MGKNYNRSLIKKSDVKKKNFEKYSSSQYISKKPSNFDGIVMGSDFLSTQKESIEICIDKKKESSLDCSIQNNSNRLSKEVYLSNAEDLYEMLQLINEGKLGFSRYRMAEVAQCLEFYYKGFLDYNHLRMDSYLFKTHNIYTLHKKIESEVMRLNASANNKQLSKILKELNYIGDCYYSTRYGYEMPTFDDFQTAMRVVKDHRKKIMSIVYPMADLSKKIENPMRDLEKMIEKDNESVLSEREDFCLE